MIINALTGEPKLSPGTLAQQEAEFTAEGAPPPGHTSGTSQPSVPSSEQGPSASAPPAPGEQGGDATSLLVRSSP